MIKLSDAPFEIYGLKAKDFFDWCKKENKPNYAIASRKEFFSLIRSGSFKKEEE